MSDAKCDPKYFFSECDFRGAITNFESIVNQYIGGNQNIGLTDKDELKSLFEQLIIVLKKIPLDRKEEIEAVVELSNNLLEIANKDKPNKVMAQISANGLKEAAKSIANMFPEVLDVVVKIADLITRMMG